MKKLVIILIFTLTVGCATTYEQILETDVKAMNIAENDDIKVTFGYQELGENDRFRENAIENNIAIMRLTIINKKEELIIVGEKDIALISEEYKILPMTSQSVSEKISLATLPYWLYGLIWVGSTDCVNDDCSSTWLPIGLIFGAINYFIAANTNSEMEEELVENSFKGGNIMPGEQISGYLFYESSKKRRCNLEVNYHNSEEITSKIIMPYNF